MSKNSDPMTYARLEEVLTKLGYNKRATDEFVAFLHEEPESIFVLPITAASDIISDWHLLSLQKVVSTSNRASTKMLLRMLNRRRSSDMSTASNRSEETESESDLATAH